MVVTGLKECIEMVEDAPKNIVMLGYARALAAGIYVIAEAVVSRAPVETGDMVKALAIDIEIDQARLNGMAAMGVAKQDHVAMWVEYGHRMVGHRPGKKVLGDVPPHPFMRPGFAASAEAAIDAFIESLSATLKSEY